MTERFSSGAAFPPLLPDIRVPPPGPASRAAARDLARFEAPGINTLGAANEPAIVWREALGANVCDVDGNRYLDFTSGFGAAAIGHRHPRVVEAVARQAELLLHGLGDVAAHPARVALARRLAALAPVDDAAVYFAVSGADAVEIALKTAALATGRPGFVAFDPGYHGLTAGALAATSRPAFRDPFVRQLNPFVARLPFGARLEEIERAIAATDSVGAILVEPLVGREGVLIPPEGWLAGLAELARRRGLLLVADEIFTGFGRTGELFAVDRERVRPDLLCCGKALGGGLPIAAVVGRRAVLEAWRAPGEARHTGTFVAHPLACAAALATLAVLDDDDLVARARGLGAEIAPRLEALVARFDRVREVRGRGLIWGLELATAEEAARFGRAALARGVLLLVGGASGRVAQIAPPLSIAPEQLSAGAELLAAALPE